MENVFHDVEDAQMSLGMATWQSLGSYEIMEGIQD